VRIFWYQFESVSLVEWSLEPGDGMELQSESEALSQNDSLELQVRMKL